MDRMISIEKHLDRNYTYVFIVEIILCSSRTVLYILGVSSVLPTPITNMTGKNIRNTF